MYLGQRAAARQLYINGHGSSTYFFDDGGDSVAIAVGSGGKKKAKDAEAENTAAKQWDAMSEHEMADEAYEQADNARCTAHSSPDTSHSLTTFPFI